MMLRTHVGRLTQWAISIAALLAVLVSAGTLRLDGQTRSDPPRLIVLLVADQFRADYVESYGHQWQHGLRRILDRGAYFTQAAYPFAATATCPGHATIATGTTPATHGMIGNGWYDRALGRTITCTDDPSVAAMAFGGRTGRERHGPRLLRVPTFADELRRQARQPVRTVALSLKARAAISLGGHGGPGAMVIWQEDNGTWATSTAYTPTPWPEVDEYVNENPMTSARGQSWTRLLPEAAYLHTDKALGEPADGVFPHALDPGPDSAEAAFVWRWARSPWSDAYLGNMAGALVERLDLGQRPGTDLLAVSFSALDLVGHQFGPRSHEVQDVLARLDVTIGTLLETLDRAVGASRYVVAFSSDHGVAPLPEQSAALGVKGGRVTTGQVARALESGLAAVLGEGKFVASGASYLAPGVLDRVQANPKAKASATAAALAVEGVERVYWADELAGRTATRDPVLRTLRLNYMKERSGDLAIVLRPYWMMQATGTTHGSPHLYDRRVPLALLGARIKPGRYASGATPVDIAPTLAVLTGIKLARTDGRVLAEALR